MAYLLRADGTITEVQPANGDCFTNDEIESLVGGYFEPVPMVTDGIMLIDDEGKLKNKPLNTQATERYLYRRSDFIVGDALVVSYAEMGER